MEIFSSLSKPTRAGFNFSATIIIYVLVAFVVQTFASLFDNALIFAIISSLSAPIAMSLVLVLNCKILKKPFLKTCGVTNFDKTYIIHAILLFIGMFFGLGFLNILISDLAIDWGVKIPFSSIPMNNVLEYLLMVFFLALVPAVFEECLFRGLIFGELSEDNIIVSCLMTGLVFALYHGSVVQLIYQFIYGVMLCLLTYRAKSVIPSIITHFLNNFAVLTFTFFNIEIDFFRIIRIVVGVIVLVTFVIAMMKGNKKITKTNDQPKQQKGKFFLGALFGIIVCLALIISGLMV